MLRTQQAQSDQTRFDDIDGICEAICLDAVEVAKATRVGIWLFDEGGAMICQRQLDGRDGSFSQGKVVPRDEAEVYVKAASGGVSAAINTEEAPQLNQPALDQDGQQTGGLQDRLDLLLVDSRNQPTAMFCCERLDQSGNWRERDIYVLRKLARALSGAIRDFGGAPQPRMPKAEEFDEVDLFPRREEERQWLH